MVLNLKLQQKGQLIHIPFCNIKAFKRKLKLRKATQRQSLSHFPMMEKRNCKECLPSFVKYIAQLQKEFEERFEDFRSHE